MMKDLNNNWRIIEKPLYAQIFKTINIKLCNLLNCIVVQLSVFKFY